MSNLSLQDTPYYPNDNEVLLIFQKEIFKEVIKEINMEEASIGYCHSLQNCTEIVSK